MPRHLGESLAGETCFGLVGFLFFVLAAAIFFAGLALQLSFGAAALGLGPVLMALGALGGIALMVVLPALSTIFQAGVYVYATTGQVPAMLTPTSWKERSSPRSDDRAGSPVNLAG